MSGALRDAVLLSFDNLGEAADLERHGAPPRGAASFGHRRAAARARRARRAGPAGDLLRRGPQRRALSPGAARHRRGRPRGRAARLAPRALGRAVARDEDERLGRSVAALAGLGLEIEGFRPPGGEFGAHTIEALAAHGLRWCSPAGEHAERRAGVASLPFRWPAVDAYHRLESFTDRRTARGDRAAVASPREAADALIGVLDARGDEPLVLILHPFLLLEDDEAAQARRVLEHLAGQVARGERWVAPGRELAPLVGA